MIHRTLTLLLLVLLAACNSNNEGIKINSAETGYSPIVVLADSIQIDGDLGNFKVDRSTQQIEKGLQIITFKFSAKTASELKPVTLRFNFPSVDISGFWNPTFADKTNYWRSAFSSKASTWAPIFTLYNNRSQNRITYALSDALNKIEFWNYIKEEDVNFHPAIRLFS